MTRKDIGIIPIIHPLPVLIISAYDKNGTIKAMNAA